MRHSLSFLFFASGTSLGLAHAISDIASEKALYQHHVNTGLVKNIRGAMLASIRTSWEQGTAAGGILEFDQPEYSVFGANPFQCDGALPIQPLQLALSAAVRQASDGRLSQVINDGEDEAALDGASAGSVVLMGTFTEPSMGSYWQNASTNQLNWLLYGAPRMQSGALSQRITAHEYWADGVYMAPPFLAYYGAVTNNQSLAQFAYENCRDFRQALLLPGPYGSLWAHIYSEDNHNFTDSGLWGTGNGWAALGMLRVAVTIMKSPFAAAMKNQTDDLVMWTKEILDGIFLAINTTDGLIPDYVTGGPGFGDSSSSAALVSVAYRCATLFPSIFGANYTDAAAPVRDAVISGVTELGVLKPVVDPLNWESVGILSTEAQSFALMMFSAWRDYLGL